MEIYRLNADEVVLFKDDCQAFGILLDGKVKDESGTLTLTNQNLVFTYKIDNEYQSVVFPVNSIKIYKEKPQVKINTTHKERVDIYLTCEEFSVSFASKKSIRLLINEVTLLLTGKSAYDEKLGKLKTGLTNIRKTIDTIDETLRIDSVALVKSAVSKVGQNTKGGKVISAVNKVAPKLPKNKPTTENK